MHKFTTEERRRGAYASAEAKNRKKEAKKLLKQLLAEELDSPVPGSPGITKAEWLVAKMVRNLSENITPKDILTLQRILGEDTSTDTDDDGLTPSERIAMYFRDIDPKS